LDGIVRGVKAWAKVNFPSKDGLKITADLYEAPKPSGFIVLCHRSHCNRAEYRETAPKLNQLGYSCLAIDQRSGMKIFGETNETKVRAKERGLPTGYLDARADIEAAVDYAYRHFNNKSVILFGSSYSASLALLIAMQTDMVKATIAFSPGEWLKGIELAQEIVGTHKPTYVTSAKAEIEQVTALLKGVSPRFVEHYIPKASGFHGSKALWAEVAGNEEYWASLKKFLSRLQ
jgi:alpha-beta hydrolase superfamily lysophospholipase